jgi:dienelactone hydrolase
MRLRFLLACACTFAAACGSEPAATTDAATGTDVAKTDATDAAPDTVSPDVTADAADATPPPPVLMCGKYKDESEFKPGPAGTLLANGVYFLAVQAKPFGDLQLFFKATIYAEGEAGEGGTIKFIGLRAIKKQTGEVTEPMAGACDVAVDKEGKFTIKFGDVVLPAKGSPTDTDVKLSLELHGKLNGDGTFCGLVEGKVPQFSVELTGSKFKAVPFGKEKNPPESSCEGNVAKVYKGIDKCPAVVAGKNSFTSAELKRDFQVLLPKAGLPAQPAPLVFLYHGVGGSSDSIIKDSGFASLLDKEQFVLVVPDSATPTDGKLKLDWYTGASLFDMDNPDLVYFDDLVKCVGDAFKTDPKRVYVTGMSGGGLATAFIALHRSKVVAAAAPMSGGYLHKWPPHDGKPAVMVTWGGPTDTAFEQKFDPFAQDLIANFKKDGHFVVSCEHTLGHKWPKDANVGAWKFLSAHTLDTKDSPLAKGLGSEFPAYCKIVP